MSIFGQDVHSADYWGDETAAYTEQVHGSLASYHAGRLRTAHRLLNRANLTGGRFVDFGCGEGTFPRQLAGDGFEVAGIDIAPSMIEVAREDVPAGVSFDVGSVYDLASQGPCDALVSLNVLAYLTDDENAAWWDAARAIVKPRGWLLVSHSNELFDLFALNAGTASFFRRNFDVDPGDLLAAEADNPTYNVRANPLTYPSLLATQGFEEVDRAFFNLHPAPPALLGPGAEGRVHDPDAIAALEPWRQMFQCSTYFSLARRRA